MSLVKNGLLGLICLLVLTACDRIIPSRPISPEALTGDWRCDYNGLGDLGEPLIGTEIITFRDDGTYQQMYRDGRGYSYTSGWSRWRLESLPNGLQQVHLDKARFYPAGVQFAEDLEAGRVGISMWDPATGRNFDLRGEAILNVVARSSAPGGYELDHLPVGDLDAPTFLAFRRVTGGREINAASSSRNQ